MAIIKLYSTSNANRLTNYCDRKADERDAMNCDPDFFREQMKMTREVWGKTDGVQAHHIIQAFSPQDTLTVKQANTIGLKLSERIASKYEAVIYTVNAGNRLYNHIIINSVSFTDGHKYHSDRKLLFKIRQVSDELCSDFGCSVIGSTLI